MRERRSLFIVGGDAFEVSTYSSLESLDGILSVRTNGSQPVRFEQPVWRDVQFGVGPRSPYLFTPRTVVELFTTGPETVEILLDEDSLAIFQTQSGYLAVCETSVRVFSGAESSRWSGGYVIESAHFVDGVVTICDELGQEARLSLIDGVLSPL